MENSPRPPDDLTTRRPHLDGTTLRRVALEVFTPPRCHPPLPRVPTKHGVVVDDRVLPLPIDHYEVLRHREWCTVMVVATGEVVFQGEGRAEVVVSRAPF